MKAAITGIGMWMPYYPSAAAWAQRDRAAEVQKPIGLAFDKRNRRRVSDMGRAIGDVVEEAVVAAGVDPVTTPLIVGSAIGEASTMIGLLDQMWRTREPMSPAAFTVSVHNAASGMISIAKKNIGFTTSIAADHDTPAAALLEGLALVESTGMPVIVACADEESPRKLLRRTAMSWDMLAAAVVLAPASAGLRLATVALPVDGPSTIAGGDFEAALLGNPQIGLLDLVDAVMRGDSGSIALDRGAGRGFCAALQAGNGR